MELLGSGDHGQDNADVLRRLLQSLQQSRKRLGDPARQGVRRPAGALAFRLRGLVNQKNRLDRRETDSRAMFSCVCQLLSDSNNRFCNCSSRCRRLRIRLLLSAQRKLQAERCRMALPLRKALVGGQATGRFAAPRKKLCCRHTAGAGFHKESYPPVRKIPTHRRNIPLFQPH